MEVISGKIQEITPHGDITIVAKYTNLDRFCKRQYDTCLIGLADGRSISPKQRQTIYAFITAVADYQGEEDIEIPKQFLKSFFNKTQEDPFEQDTFSLSDCSMTVAHDFIKFLLMFLLKWDIPVFIGNQQVSLLDFISHDKDLIAHHVWASIRYKKCAVCGGHCELHHTPAIGMGFDRTEIVHEGLTVQPLCRIHHSEAHTKGQKEFDKLYHLTSIALDKELCKIYGLKQKGEN
jgi:hypothetical protein